MDNKSKVQKFLGMLRNGQNSAFVSLVCDNLKVELQQKPWKAIKIMGFLIKEVSLAKSDFTRLKLIDGLVPLLEQHSTQDFIKSLIEHAAKNEKARKKLMESAFAVDPLSPESERACFGFADMLRSRKSLFTDLLEHYQPLLAELDIAESPSQQQQNAATKKENISQMFMEGALGGRIKTDKLKLSDFIDESFFEDMDLDEQTVGAAARRPKSQLSQLSEYVREMKKKAECTTTLIPSPVQNGQKRLKTTQSEKPMTNNPLIILSPLLALVITILKNDSLVDNDWKVRQHAAYLMTFILNTFPKSLDYYLVSEDEKQMTILSVKKVNPKDVASALLPQVFLVILKDNFNDFEELKVLSPVRDEALKLLVTLIPYLQEDDIKLLIQQLPNLLKCIDAVASDSWITKYNFFIYLKALFTCDNNKEMRTAVFQMFNRVLIESLLNSEDEVRILVTEVINMVLPMMLEQAEFEKQIGYLIKNLQKNLKQSDEIESSAISVFALITRIIDSVPQLERLNIRFDLKTYCPFNFHQVVNVRYSYLQILNKCLSSIPLTFSQEDLQMLLKLTLQSIAMERSKLIVKLNLENLRLIASTMKSEALQMSLDQLFHYEQSLPYLLYTYQMTSFESFLFYESKNFESLNRDYFKIIFRPVTQDEISSFYFGKMRNMSKAMAIVMQTSAQSQIQVQRMLETYLLPPETMQQGLQPPVHDAHLFYLLTLQEVLTMPQEVDATLNLNFEHLEALSSSFLCNLSEDLISIFHFRHLPRLQTLLQVLRDLTSRKPPIALALAPLYPIFDIFYHEHKLTNLANLHQLLEQTLAPTLAEASIDTNIYECFSELRDLVTQLLEYASAICTRIKQVSACLHLELVKKAQTQLSAQLNLVIKPILNQVKKESVVFLQRDACKGCVTLLEVLEAKGKQRPAQQVLQLLMKDIEAMEVVTEKINEVQVRGVEEVFKVIVKQHKNLLEAFSGYIVNYLKQDMGYENAIAQARVLHFILKVMHTHQRLTAKDIYSPPQRDLLVSKLQTLLTLQELLLSETPHITLYLFTLFPSHHPKIITHLVSVMSMEAQSRHRSAFDSLIKLLDNLQDFQSSSSTTGGQHDFLKYISVFIIPVIQNIQASQQIYGDNKSVTLILAQLLSLLPLNLASLQPKQDGLEESKSDDPLQLQAREGYNFLQIFVNNDAGVETYKMKIKVKATLRDYQMQGITWLAQLGQYNLNCALCDDMGLGKTLQSLCVVLNESLIRRERNPQFAVTNLIVCPTTITYNWRSEIRKYFDNIRVGIYEGSSAEKTQIIKNPQNYDVIIISYEKLRNEIKQFLQIPFFYVILDEAHIIKNSKAKITQSVKSLQCEKKIILTGTPLQNKVSELWSIFDFLMPGFLEEETVFNKKYNQYLTSNIKKLSEKLEETQTFINALKSLKKRIQPFIMRRTKDQVLKELPPKIIQDVICKMTSFQEYVHGVVDKNHPIVQTIQQQQQPAMEQVRRQQGKSILQNLILHRKVCNHPVFVASDFIQDRHISSYLEKKSEAELRGYEQSGKLMGLVDKLAECEIIERQAEETKGGGIESDELMLVDPVNDNKKHRALIFCQMGTFLRMIVQEILVKFKIPYLELLSTHSPKDRIDIVDKFNGDEDIRVLILTTAVGGLGLTLTGADTVIFAEHDWNPMKDLQAIDRAHRIGQTRQVCVYRLIMQDTLEEKIMNLQRFKENLARSLVQSKEASVDQANQMELTDLLQSFQEHSAFTQVEKAASKKGAFEDKIITGIEEIWQGGAFSAEDL